MESTADKNPQQTASVQGDTIQALEARLKAAEANPAEAREHRRMGDGNVASEAQTKTETTTVQDEKTPPGTGDKDGLRQFKDKGGKVDDSRIEKANEHLERGLKQREELLKRNKELLSKFTKTSMELAETKKALGAGGGALSQMPEGGGGQDLDKAFLGRLAKAEEDPLVLRELIREEARALYSQESNEIRSAVESIRRDKYHSERVAELVQLVEEGHTWIETEGLERFDRVFQEKPFLMQSPTPYLDAMAFIKPLAGAASAPARSGGPIPILGSGSAVPPPSSQPTATKEQKMNELSKQFHEALKWNDRVGAQKIMEEMDRHEQGR